MSPRSGWVWRGVSACACDVVMAMESFYRTMARDPDGRPRVGRSATMLGVRIDGEHADVHPDARGDVRPGGGGMSVTIDDREMMPTIRRPRWIGDGASKHPLFVLMAVDVPGSLQVRDGGDAHGFVEPVEPTPLSRYEDDLTSTRPHWREEFPDGSRA